MTNQGTLVLDPYRVEFPGDFVWQVPSELQGQVELLRRSSANVSESPLAERLDLAMNAPHLDVRLSQLVTPGDRVTLAIDPHTPSLIPLLAMVLSELVRFEAELPESFIVLPAHAAKIAEAIRASVAEVEALREIKVILHNATDRSAIAYLGANEVGEPIYMARALAEADVVIPIFAADGGETGRPGNAARFLHRYFAGTIIAEPDKDREPRKRKPEREPKPSPKQSARDAEEAYWQLGVLYGMVVSAGAGGEADCIIAGAEPLLDKAIADAQRNWICPAIAPAGLVIAEVSGGVDQQNWGSVARALQLAKELTEPNGIIVLLSDLAEGEISRRAMRAATRGSEAHSQPGEDHGVSAFAVALKSVRGANPVFLRSQLSEEATEDLRMGFVSKPAELSRLVERQPRCILIRDAQHVQIDLGLEVAQQLSRQSSHAE